MTTPRSLRPGRDWAEVYREAEEGDDTDVPAAIRAGRYSGALTEAEAERLMGVYEGKVGG